jgi:hypothetical protein
MAAGLVFNSSSNLDAIKIAHTESYHINAAELTHHYKVPSHDCCSKHRFYISVELKTPRNILLLAALFSRIEQISEAL